MASTISRQPTPILPPSTPSNGNSNANGRPSPALSQQSINHLQREIQNSSTPTSESRMNPPSIPRSLMTPARDMRESSVLSAAGSSARKPRQNLDERDHILMVKHCLEQKDGFKEGTKAQFWTGVNTAFQRDTGKILAQMSATVGRLVEARRRQISDWENGVIPQKPGGELNDSLDEWMEFLKIEDGDAEAERMRQVDARRKVEEARKEARRQAIAAEAAAGITNGESSRASYGPAPQPPGSMQQQPQQESPRPIVSQAQGQHQYLAGTVQSGEMVVANDQPVNGYPRPSHKRKRLNERQLTREMQDQMQAEQHWHVQQQSEQAEQSYAIVNQPEPPRRVVVEGAMTKEDWRDIMGNDARLRALETKLEKIDTLVSQNNKLLLQLVANQARDQDEREKERNRNRHVEDEERVPVHLDADFERDYL